MAAESAADLAAMFSPGDFGAAAVYTPAGGGASESVTVILDKTAPVERLAGDVPAVIRGRRLLAPKSAFATAPAKGAGFVIGGTSYTAGSVADWEDDPSGTIYAIALRLA